MLISNRNTGETNNPEAIKRLLKIYKAHSLCVTTIPLANISQSFMYSLFINKYVLDFNVFLSKKLNVKDHRCM